MEEKVLNTILLEFQKLNERLDHIEKENENKFALIDARFNTLEEMVLSMQQDIGTMKSEFNNRMTQFEAKLSDFNDRMAQFEERISSVEKITLRMEYTFNDKISALFDANTYQDDQYRSLDNRIRKIEMKVEKLSISHC